MRASRTSKFIGISVGATLVVAALWVNVAGPHLGLFDASGDGASSVIEPGPRPEVRIDAADEPARLEAVQRYLKASAYLAITRSAMQRTFESIQAQTQQDPRTPEIKQLFTADAASLEQAIAPVLASRLSLDQARQIAAFYESAAGRFVVEQSLAADASAMLKGAAHEPAIDAFFKSSAAEVMIGAINDPAVLEALMQAAQSAPRMNAGKSA